MTTTLTDWISIPLVNKSLDTRLRQAPYIHTVIQRVIIRVIRVIHRVIRGLSEGYSQGYSEGDEGY